ncbi:MAG: hypothetical protein KIT68_05950 [Phycisphaeraceae bacterium]|nr:hypothetical protein [Phycisphaeraceae bacterium]
MSPAGQRPNWLTTLGWSAYLACSWTWCIGMFLPIILVRDYGAWAFVAFALPNIIGAAAMAWFLGGRDRADAFFARHAGIVRMFSSVTIAFQVYFACWLVSVAVPNEPLARAAPTLLLLPAVVRGVSDRAVRAIALVIWAASAATLAAYLSSVGPPALALNRPPESGLWPIAASCLFGFALCPYLDATFLRACRDSHEPRTAFGIGFGVLFFAMIGGTLLYLPVLTDLRALRDNQASTLLLLVIALHILPQLVFTIGVHAGESRRCSASVAAIWAPAAAVLAFCVSPLFDPNALVGTLHLGEAIYRGFMGFYGLVFPAYVALVVCARPAPTGSASPAAMLLFCVAVVAAGPFFFAAFMWRDGAWVWPGLGILALARLVLWFVQRSGPAR